MAFTFSCISKLTDLYTYIFEKFVSWHCNSSNLEVKAWERQQSFDLNISNFSIFSFYFGWADVSNTPHRVSLPLQTPQILWTIPIFSTLFSVFGHPNETQSLVFNVIVTCRTCTYWRGENWQIYICTCTLTWASCSLTGCTSFSSRFVLSSLTPQLISKPTPPTVTKVKQAVYSTYNKLISARTQHHRISTLECWFCNPKVSGSNPPPSATTSICSTVRCQRKYC